MASDDRVVTAKRHGNGSNDFQFMMRTDAGTAPEPLEIWLGDVRIITGNDLDLNTWYLAVVTNAVV